MRFLIGLLLISLSNISFSQENALVNSWGKGSRFIYLGLNNELKHAESGRIYSASSREASVSISSDSTSLIVKPRVYGPVTITLGTGQDSLTLVYQSTSMPFPQISIGEAGFNVPTVTHDQLASAASLRLRGDGKEASGFYDNCQISCCEVQIGDHFYSFPNGEFTDEVRAALAAVPEGEKVIIKRMILQVKSTGKTIRMDPGTTFLVKGN